METTNDSQAAGPSSVSTAATENGPAGDIGESTLARCPLESEGLEFLISLNLTLEEIFYLKVSGGRRCAEPLSYDDEVTVEVSMASVPSFKHSICVFVQNFIFICPEGPPRTYIAIGSMSTFFPDQAEIFFSTFWTSGSKNLQ